MQKVWVGEESRLTIFDSFLREKGAIFQENTSHHDYGKQRLVWTQYLHHNFKFSIFRTNLSGFLPHPYFWSSKKSIRLLYNIRDLLGNFKNYQHVSIHLRLFASYLNIKWSGISLKTNSSWFLPHPYFWSSKKSIRPLYNIGDLLGNF